jgi:transposase
VQTEKKTFKVKLKQNKEGLFMQICYLHPAIVALYKSNIPEEAKRLCHERRDELVRKWDELKRNNVKDSLIASTLDISRATFYRYKKQLRENVYKSKAPKHFKTSRFGEDVRSKILDIRTENPTWGKNKIAPILRKKHNIAISESSVGRILKTLNVPKSLSAVRSKRSRKFKGFARPHTFKKYEKMEIGERVQIDHMTVTKNGITVKQFSAWDRRSKTIYSNVYRDAKSSTARKFLEEFLANVPYEVKSIQVDGGSEFMADFEEGCREHGTDLFVLPPARPTYNGGVERSNRTFREEFYAGTQEDSMMGMRREVKKFVKKYNEYRPHEGLCGLTPAEYLALPPDEKKKLDDNLHQKELKRRENRLKKRDKTAQ